MYQMNFYVIKPSLNKEIIGNYPQVKDIKYNCHVWDEPKFIEHINFEHINFNPITANAVLNDSSKITDLIDVSGMGFSRKLLISSKLKSILEENRISGMQFFPSNLIERNKIVENYWVLNMYEIDMDLIDFKNSEIYETKDVFDKLSLLKINSIDEFKSKQEEIESKGFPYGIQIDKIHIVENSVDFFALLHVEGSVKYIVSERLKQIIEDEGCIGLEFMPVEMKLTEWLQGGEREKIYGK